MNIEEFFRETTPLSANLILKSPITINNFNFNFLNSPSPKFQFDYDFENDFLNFENNLNNLNKNNFINFSPKKVLCNYNVNNNKWQTVYIKQGFNLNLQVSSKTRCDKSPLEEIPKKLYSSLKYQIKQTLTGDSINFHPIFYSKIRVLNFKTNKEIKKNKQSILKGTKEVAILNLNKNKKEGTLKVQFTDVSFHHNKEDFMFEISIYLPDDLKNPILICKSSNFKVYARKINKNENKKEEKNKKFFKFKKMVEELGNIFQNMEEQEKDEALTIFTKKIQMI